MVAGSNPARGANKNSHFPHAELDARLEAARLAGDISGMQPLIAKKQSLLVAMYGTLV
jgi:hypothetical protein